MIIRFWDSEKKASEIQSVHAKKDLGEGNENVYPQSWIL